MISDINKYVDFLTINKLSEHQFLILWLVYTKDQENIKKLKNCRGFDIHAIEYLITHKWLDDFGLVKDNQHTFNIYDFIVTDKFTKVVVIDEDDAYEELVAVYPKWMTIQGIKRPAANGDPYKLAKEYFKYYKGNRIAHNRVIDITERYFKNNPVVEGIEKYILNRRWNLLEEELSSGKGIDVFKTL